MYHCAIRIGSTKNKIKTVSSVVEVLKTGYELKNSCISADDLKYFIFR